MSQEKAINEMVSHFCKITWAVELSLKYKKTYFKRRYSSLSEYTSVLVNAKQFIKYAHNNPYIPFVEEIKYWDNRGIEKMIRLFDCSIGFPEMAIAHFGNYKVKTGWFFKKVETKRYIAFTNGRHRSRYLHDIGISEFPVEKDNKSV